MISRLRAFGAFWYDFVIGDDWRVALGVIFGLAVTYVASRFTDAPLWWIVVVTVAVLLPVSIHRIARRSSRQL
jgi:multisubunit Na+/H+ antiporter MnhE subunit